MNGSCASLTNLGCVSPSGWRGCVSWFRRWLDAGDGLFTCIRWPANGTWRRRDGLVAQRWPSQAGLRSPSGRAPTAGVAAR